MSARSTAAAREVDARVRAEIADLPRSAEAYQARLVNTAEALFSCVSAAAGGARDADGHMCAADARERLAFHLEAALDVLRRAPVIHWEGFGESVRREIRDRHRRAVDPQFAAFLGEVIEPRPSADDGEGGAA